MLSRVANSLYWLARYLERAENSARLLAVTNDYVQQLRGISHAAADQCWDVAWRLLSGEEGSRDMDPAVFWRLALDEEVPNSLLACVARARENARGIRDAIASEMWEELNVLYMRMQEEAGAAPSETNVVSLTLRIRTASHLFQGRRDNTMSRRDEWHFLCFGQFLERADMTARILSEMFSHPALPTAEETGHNIDTLHLTATLRTCTALEAFSRTGRALTPERVAEFLLLENHFPRSVEFCVQEVGDSLHALSGTPHDVFTNEAEQLAGRLVAELRFARIEEIRDQGLQPYLLQVLDKLGNLSWAISQEYFP
jgi:uncharacterized alpha-E superfamily protein